MPRLNFAVSRQIWETDDKEDEQQSNERKLAEAQQQQSRGVQNRTKSCLAYCCTVTIMMRTRSDDRVLTSLKMQKAL